MMADDPTDGAVDVLSAEDAGTETRLGETRTASYVDLTDGRAARRPIIPPHLRDGDGTYGVARGVSRHLRNQSERHGYSLAYHGVRSPGYLIKTVLFSLVGLFRLAHRIINWWHATDLYRLEHEAAAAGLLSDHLKIHRQGRDTRTARGIMVGVCAFVVLVGLVLMLKFGQWWWWALLAAVVVPLLARHGRPAGKPIVQSAVLPPSVIAPNQDVITRALGSLGIAGIDRWLREERPLVFPAPVREDGPGWRADVDLPYGVTAEMVIERRPQLAAGLRRPLGAVWPEPVMSEHPGRLDLWVGRQDIAKARQSPWPLLRAGEANIFEPVPFATDVRGRVVKVPLAYHNWLIGSIPRQGKTASVRVLACAAALDPLCELWVHELKGSGDLDPLERVSHRFCSGVDDQSIEYAALSLKLLRREIEHRTDRLKQLDRDLCPDKRTTRQIAARRSLKLWPLVCIIDEAQNLFADSEWGKQAGDDAQFCIKIGPAFGVILIIATQRPDKQSLPTGVSGNASTRFCLKVMGQVENDMILGTSAYKNGIKATTFRPEIDAGIGYLVGGGPAPVVVRTFYLDMDATDRVCKRARAVREQAGTLSGVALGDDALPDRDVLADLGAVFFADEAGLQWAEAAARLRDRFPDRWAGATGDSLSAEAREIGVPSVDVRAGASVAKGARRRDVGGIRAGRAER